MVKEKLTANQLSNCMQHSPWNSESCSDGHKITKNLCNLKINGRVHKIVRVHSHENSVHILIYYSSKIQFNNATYKPGTKQRPPNKQMYVSH
jgi:hypothetical protein